MKKTIALFTLLLSYVTAGAQQPHTVVGYTPNSNTLTALRYGYGNSLETITIAGKTLTTIKVSSNGQPKSISNEFATEDFTFAGTSKVTVTQTVNGETKTSTVAMNSDKVLQLRKEFSQIKTSLSGFVGQADKFLESGGASLIGNIINTINDGIENPINMCFQQALDAAKDSKNPIIPIDCLEALVKATKSHESAGDKLKGKMVDYIFQNYGEWRDSWSDLVYKGMMEIDKRQQAENKQKNQNKVDAAKKLLEKGASLDDVSKILDEIYNNKGHNNAPGKSEVLTKEGNTQNEVKKVDDTEEKQVLDTPNAVLDYVKGKFPDRGGRLPDAIWVNYHRTLLGSGFSYMMKLNKDKKTYRYEKVNDEFSPDYDRELDNPYCYMVIWYWDSKEKGIEVTIPLAKGHIPSKLPK